MKRLINIVLFLFLSIYISGQVVTTSVYFAPPSYVENTLLTGLTSYWDFDETSGTTTYDIHSTYDGTLADGIPTINQTGKIGKCYLFVNADDEKVECGTTVGNVGTSDFAVSAWIYLADGADNYSICGKYQGAAPQYHFYVSSSNKLTFYWKPTSAAATYCNGATTLEDSTWYNVIVSVDRSANAVIYVNGNSDGTLDVSGSSGTDITNSKDFILGGRYYGGDTYSWNGLLDELGLWYRCFTQTDVNYLYNSNSGYSYINFK